MGQEWFTSRFEFPNADGTRIFALDKPTPGSPILLYSKPADQAHLPFEEIPFSTSYAVPVLALLARDAAAMGDGCPVIWLYDVVWSNEPIESKPRRRLKGDSNATRVHQEVGVLRKIVGDRTIYTNRGDGMYRLTVEVTVANGPLAQKPAHKAQETVADIFECDGPTVPEVVDPLPNFPPPAPTPLELYGQRQTPVPATSNKFSRSEALKLSGCVLFFVGCVAIIAWSFFHKTRHEFLTIQLKALPRGILGLILFWLVQHWLFKLRVYFRRRKLLRKGNKLVIYVGRLGNDQLSSDVKERVIASIRNELGPEIVEVRGSRLTFKVGDDGEDQAAKANARKVLESKCGDLLIYGKVYTIADRAMPQVDLRFVSAEYYRGRPQLFALTDRLVLDAHFGPELGTALTAVASAMAASTILDCGRFITDVIKPLVERVEGLISANPKLSERDRATLLDSYGILQLTVALQTRERDRFESVLAASREASKQHDRNTAPFQWADTQSRIGTTLVLLAETDESDERLQEGIAILREIVSELGHLFGAATIKMNLGVALLSLNQREGGMAGLEEAASMLRSAVEQLADGQWTAMFIAMSNLGFALTRWGEKESGSAHLAEAVTVLRSATTEQARIAVPAYWATLQSTLGFALTRLSLREEGDHHLAEAVTALRAAAEECTRDRDPINWGVGQIQLATALRHMGLQQCEEAVPIAQAALEECTRERVPTFWAAGKVCLALTLTTLGEQQDAPERIAQAVDAFEEALQVITFERAPFEWGRAKLSLACALASLAHRKGDTDLFNRAVKEFQDASIVMTPDLDPMNYEFIQRQVNQAAEFFEHPSAGE